LLNIEANIVGMTVKADFDNIPKTIGWYWDQWCDFKPCL